VSAPTAPETSAAPADYGAQLRDMVNDPAKRALLLPESAQLRLEYLPLLLLAKLWLIPAGGLWVVGVLAHGTAIGNVAFGVGVVPFAVSIVWFARAWKPYIRWISACRVEGKRWVGSRS
jgi:hypothetical protein